MAYSIEMQLSSKSTFGAFPVEYLDYIMMTQLYHCTPKEFDEQDPRIIQLHKKFLNAERRAEQKRSERNTRTIKR